jgi:hypothetical protein
MARDEKDIIQDMKTAMADNSPYLLMAVMDKIGHEIRLTIDEVQEYITQDRGLLMAIDLETKEIVVRPNED